MNTTLELYGAPTGNCIRAAIALEEAGLPYTRKLVDLSSGEHTGADHLARNPAGKVPVLVEKEEGREPFVLTQSNAIILYAAAKAPGRLLPESDRERAVAYERFLFYVTDVIAVSHAGFSLRFLSAHEGRTTLEERVIATLATADRYVAHDEFMAGRTFSVADIAGYTITRSVKADLPWSTLPNLRRWFDQIEGRVAVQRGLKAFNAT